MVVSVVKKFFFNILQFEEFTKIHIAYVS